MAPRSTRQRRLLRGGPSLGTLAFTFSGERQRSWTIPSRHHPGARRSCASPSGPPPSPRRRGSPTCGGAARSKRMGHCRAAAVELALRVWSRTTARNAPLVRDCPRVRSLPRAPTRAGSIAPPARRGWASPTTRPVRGDRRRPLPAPAHRPLAALRVVDRGHFGVDGAHPAAFLGLPPLSFSRHGRVCNPSHEKIAAMLARTLSP
jgi:hypothetical protein